MTEKVDVIINVFGKPFQTICSLKSLIKHCSLHIDKIYYIIENNNLFNDSVSWVSNHFNNIEVFTKKHNSSSEYPDININKTKEERFGVHYQYGIEKSNKKYVFIMHNDVLFKGDIIGDMLSQIGSTAGIGLIGQCWNCPAYYAKLCDRDTYEQYNPTYEEAIKVLNECHDKCRTTNDKIDKIKPMPFPECRVNEFACVINREITMRECYPNGDTPLFGIGGYTDIACGWFKSLMHKGYKFKNYYIPNICDHGYWSNTCGQDSQINIDKYIQSEKVAKEYYLKNYKNVSN